MPCMCGFFFFNDTATTEIYTLSLHDALPICGSAPAFYIYQFSRRQRPRFLFCPFLVAAASPLFILPISRCGSVPLFILPISRCGSAPAFYTANFSDRKSTRLNSSHTVISYAVFCLKKKKLISIFTYSTTTLLLHLRTTLIHSTHL